MNVLVGMDESEYSGSAIRYITGLTWPKDTRFVVLSAAPSVVLGPGEAVSPQVAAELLEDEEARHLHIAESAALCLQKKGLTAGFKVMRGDPRTSLIETARTGHFDLIVLGSHGRTGIKKFLLGSVASSVVTHAPCSVLVVKQDNRDV